MQIHNVKSRTKRTRHVQIGRGGKRGKTSSRGTKGQKARSGRKLRPEIREVIKKIPKLRGYAFNTIQTDCVIVKLDRLADKFKAGDEVNQNSLVEKGLVSIYKGRIPKIKILLGAKDHKPAKLTIKGIQISATARKAIEDAGGTIGN